MHDKKRFAIALTGLTICLLFVIAFGQGSNPQDSEVNPNPLVLNVTSDKHAFTLGEIVNLHFTVTNETSGERVLAGGSNVYTGSIRIFLADEGGDFKQYYGPGWGIVDATFPEIVLKPGESYRTDATLLWNPVLETSHLSPEAAKRAVVGKVSTAFALPEVGSYWIKATLDIPRKGSVYSVQSDPIQIVVNAPEGENNNKIWDTLKGNAEFAYFMHKGAFLTDSPVEKASLLKVLEEMVANYPNSFYSEIIRGKLIEYRQKESELLEKKRRLNLN